MRLHCRCVAHGCCTLAAGLVKAEWGRARNRFNSPCQARKACLHECWMPLHLPRTAPHPCTHWEPKSRAFDHHLYALARTCAPSSPRPSPQPIEAPATGSRSEHRRKQGRPFEPAPGGRGVGRGARMGGQQAPHRNTHPRGRHRRGTMR